MTRARDLANIADGTFTATDLNLSGTLDVSGDANFDSGTLFVDVSANNVGIGTSSPASKLSIAAGDILLDNTRSIIFKDSGGTARGILQYYSDNSTYLDAPNGSTIFRNGASNTEKMRIALDGKVGIGTSSPSLATGGGLQVQADTFSSVRVTETGNTGLDISQAADAKGYVYLRDNADLIFGTNNAERLRISSSGRVLINTTTAAELLNVANTAGNGAGVEFAGNGNTIGSTSAFYGQGSGSDAYVWNRSNSPVLFGTNNTERMRLDASGNVGLGVTPSAWTSFNVFQASRGSIAASTTETDVSHNAFFDGSWKYIANGFATNHYQASGEYIWRTAASGTAGNAISFTQAMTLDASGNLLVGTTGNPGGYRLEVYGDAHVGVNSENRGLYIGPHEFTASLRYNGNGNFEIAPRSGYSTVFLSETSGSERMRIDSSGNLLVGTTTAVGKFSIEATPTGTARSVDYSNTGGTVDYYIVNNVNVGSISVTTTATAYNTSSDYRLKDVNGPITNSGAYIDALKPVQGSWKADGSRFIGLIAHEVQEISETPIATGEKDGEEMQGMDYSAPELIANLIAEIQSLRARVAQLEGV